MCSNLSILIALLFVLFSFSVAGQSYPYKKRTVEEKARYYTKKMTDSLSVTDSCEEKLYEINLEVSKRFNSVYADSSLVGSARKKAFRTIYQYRDSCLKATLPRKEFLKFLDLEREKWERKKKVKSP